MAAFCFWPVCALRHGRFSAPRDTTVSRFHVTFLASVIRHHPITESIPNDQSFSIGYLQFFVAAAAAALSPSLVATARSAQAPAVFPSETRAIARNV